jgi:hypothetical protein
MTGICHNPAGIRPMPYRKTIPSYLPQLRPGIRALPPWAAPQRSRARPAGMMQRHPSPPPNEASSGPSARAPVFYGLVALRTLGRTVLSLLRVNPIKLLVFVAVINGVAAAPFLVVDLRVSGSRRIMGDYVNATPSASSDGSPRPSWPPAIASSPPEESASDPDRFVLTQPGRAHTRHAG